MPTQIQELKNLRILGLSNNRLIELQNDVCTLGNLKELYINKNLLSKLPDGIFLTNNKNFKLSYKGNLILQNDIEINNVIENLKNNEDSSSIEQKELKPQRKKLFISYSHFDNKWKDIVMQHLKSLENVTGHEIFPWSDDNIPSGKNIEQSISEVLNQSKVGILLFSANYLSSDFVTRKEIPPMLQKKHEEGMILKSIILGRCLYNHIPSFTSLKAVNDIKRPLNKMDEGERDEVLNKMCEELIIELNLKPKDFESQ